MELWEVVGAAAMGFLAGAAGGLVGVGGGVLFVPALVLFLGLRQLDAESTSLLAVVAVAAVGAWRQSRYGNLRLKDGVIIGLLSPLGVLAGTVASNLASERLLQLSFAVVQVVFAFQVAKKALRTGESPSGA
jgi:uncharacterized membrane protein YfcA